MITPIGDEDSIVRRKTDGVIDAVIQPVMTEMEYELVLPHKMNATGSIIDNIIREIVNDELVIANLTSLNPNVMYELAIRHAVSKPLVCIAEYNTKLPFDIGQDRVIFYNDDMFNVEPLKEDIKQKVNAALNCKVVDNPISRAIHKNEILKIAESSLEGDLATVLKYIVDNISTMKNIMSTNNISASESIMFFHDLILSLDKDYYDKIALKKSIRACYSSCTPPIGNIQIMDEGKRIIVEKGNRPEIVKKLVQMLENEYSIRIEICN